MRLIPDLNKEFTIKKDEVTFQCKVVAVSEHNDYETVKVQILGKVEGGRIEVEKEPRFIDVNPSWFD
jgi:hypothetical protein